MLLKNHDCEHAPVFCRSRRALLLSLINHMTCKFTTMPPNIRVTPASALVDEKVAIEITGLEPGSTVTLRAQMEERKMKFESHGHYIADLDGKIDLRERPSVGGCFIGKQSDVGYRASEWTFSRPSMKTRRLLCLSHVIFIQ